MPIVPLPIDAVRELTEYRTPRSKRFLLPSGEQKIHCRLGLVHYLDEADGQFKDIELETEIEPGSGDVVATRLPYRFRLLRQGVGFTIRFRGGGTVRVELRRVGGDNVSQTAEFPFTRNGREITFEDVATDLDVVLRINRGGIQIFRRLKSASAARAWRWAVIHDAAGLAKVDTEIRGRDNSKRRLAGLTLTNGSGVDIGGGMTRYLCDETWDGTVITRDPVTRIPSVTSDPQYPVLIDPDVTEEIAATAEDGYQYRKLTVYLENYYNTLGIYFSTYTLEPMWRFTTVPVAQGATISLAELKVNVKIAYLGGGGGTIYGAVEDSAAAWTNATRPHLRTKTSASAVLTRQGTAGIKTFNVTSIVQEIVNRAGWVSNNHLALFTVTYETTTGQFTSFEDFSHAGTDEAVLEITLAAAATNYPQLERGTRGLARGMCLGLAH